MSDEKILEMIDKGDELALEVLYKKHYRMMVNLIIRNNGTEEDAKDIFQDALVVFWQKASSKELVLTSKISTYLYSVCQNLWRKELVRKKRMSSEETEQIAHPEFDRNERIRLLNECIDSLGETCQKVLRYYYFDRLSMNEIAKRMGFSNSDTAKTKKYKCKKDLDKKVKSLYAKSDFFD